MVCGFLFALGCEEQDGKERHTDGEDPKIAAS
jgi:hypothetical protein